jgi:hypothetical protein
MVMREAKNKKNPKKTAIDSGDVENSGNKQDSGSMIKILPIFLSFHILHSLSAAPVVMCGITGVKGYYLRKWTVERPGGW